MSTLKAWLLVAAALFVVVAIGSVVIQIFPYVLMFVGALAIARKLYREAKPSEDETPAK